MTVPALEKSEDPASSAYDGAPWGLTLRDGRRCIGLQGAHDNFNDRVVDFDCGTSHTVILRGLRRAGTVWRGDSAMFHASTNAYAAGPTLTIATVWWGEPSA
ncbi:MAG: hypothetical protein JWP14_2423 [Frankiales bacterium]|nr:hypothetical protein [Frankiales bacterium]